MVSEHEKRAREARLKAYERKQRRALISGVLAMVLMLLVAAISIWLHTAAPCKYVNWMPTKDVPNRCLSVDTR